MSGSSARQAFAAAVLPPLVVVTAYAVAFVPETTRDLSAVEEALAAADGSGADAAELTRVEARVGELRDETGRLAARATGAAAVAPDAGVRAAPRLADFLARHRLELVEEAAAGAPAAAQLPAPSAAAGANARPHRLRTVRFRGGYLDALGAFAEIAREPALPLAVNVTMARDAAHPDTLLWEVLAWM